MTDESSQLTLHELATARREMDRPTHVHVVGDLDQDPPRGIATAKRVAHLLVGKDGEVQQLDDDPVLERRGIWQEDTQ